MRGNRIIMELVPGRVAVIVTDGRRHRFVLRRDLDLESEPAAWTASVGRLGSALQECIAENGLTGMGAVVLYESPTQMVDVVSLPGGSASEAMAAAKLACTEALGVTQDAAMCRAGVLGRDRPGEGRQTHAIVAAERDDVLRAIESMVQEAGLRFLAATPLEAVVFAEAARALLRTGAPNCGRLYLGERSSVFVAGGSGRLALKRRLSIGVNALRTGLTRPIQRRGSTELIELTSAEAQHLLLTHGFPEHDAILETERRLRGSEILPLLQPPTQRLIVELRQSLRFGLPEADRASFTLALGGPGAQVPGLAEVIARDLEIEVSRERGEAVHDTSSAQPAGALALALERPGLERMLSLEPAALAQRRRASRVKRCLWAGAVAACAVLAVDLAQHQAQLTQAQRQLDQLARQRGDVETLRESSARINAAIEAHAALMQSINHELRTQPDLAAALREISALVPPSVRFSSIEFDDRQSGEAAARLVGIAINDPPGQAAATLPQLVAALRNSPLFAQVALGDVSRARTHGGDARQFVITLHLVPTPHDPAPPTVAARHGEVTP